MHIGEVLNCEDKVFLSDVTAAYELDGDKVGCHTSQAVRQVKTGLQELLQSNDPAVIERLDAIDATFIDVDDSAYTISNCRGFEPGRRLTRQLARANRRQFVNFAYWYQDRVYKLGEQLQADRPALDIFTLERTEQLIFDGIFPKSASAIMGEVLDWSPKYNPIGSVEQAANNYSGYCDWNGIGIANLYSFPQDFYGAKGQLQQTAFHENLHAVGHIGAERRSLFTGIEHRTYFKFNRWLEEAFVSEISLEAVRPTIKNFNAQTLSQPYQDERAFLAIVMQTAPQPLSLRELSFAHFSGRSARNNIRSYVGKLLRQTTAGLFPEYGQSAFFQINDEYNQAGTRPLRTQYMGKMVAEATKRLNGQPAAEQAG